MQNNLMALKSTWYKLYKICFVLNHQMSPGLDGEDGSVRLELTKTPLFRQLRFAFHDHISLEHYHTPISL